MVMHRRGSSKFSEWFSAILSQASIVGLPPLIMGKVKHVFEN